MKDQVNQGILISALRKGSIKAFEKIYAHYYERLCNYLLNYSQDRSKIEDVVQETFIMLWNKRKSLNIHSSLSNYLYRTAHNKMMDAYREKGRTDTFLMEYYHTALIRAEKKEDEYKKNLLQKLKACMQSLPQRCREVFTACKLSKKTNQEVAQEMDIALKTVEGHVSKGYRLLKECMEQRSE